MAVSAIEGGPKETAGILLMLNSPRAYLGKSTDEVWPASLFERDSHDIHI